MSSLMPKETLGAACSKFVGMGRSLERSMVGRPDCWHARPLPPGLAENLHIPVKQAAHVKHMLSHTPVAIFWADVFSRLS